MAAAAVAINPVLVTVSLTGKRRKRGAETDEGITPELEEKIHEMQVYALIYVSTHFHNKSVISSDLPCNARFTTAPLQDL